MTARTKDELLDTWRDAFDSAYTTPLEEEDDGRGADLVHGFAAIMERSSQGVDETTQAYYLTPHSSQTSDPASGAVKATGAIKLSNPLPAEANVLLLIGDIFEVTQLDTRGELVIVAEIELTENVNMGQGAAGISVDVQAVRAGTQANGGPLRSVRPKPLTVASVAATNPGSTLLTDDGLADRFTEDMVGRFVRFVTGSNAGTLPRRITAATLGTVTVEGVALLTGSDAVEVVGPADLGIIAELDGELSGGRHAWLDQRGGDRDVGRNAGEGDDTYRPRVTALPDVVSPNAILRAVGRILRPKGIDFEVIETRPHDRTEFGGFYADTDFADREVTWDSGDRRWLTGTFARRGFVVLVEDQPASGDFSIYCDADPFTLTYPLSFCDVGYCDGFALTFRNDIAELLRELDKVKAYGVPYAVVVVDSL